jgi:hypothetical protein
MAARSLHPPPSERGRDRPRREGQRLKIAALALAGLLLAGIAFAVTVLVLTDAARTERGVMDGDRLF